MKLKTLIPALLCATGFAAAKSPVETYGMLSIKNKKLVDSAGNQVVLRGMSLFWHYDKGGKEFWTPSVVKYAQVNWHNTVIRAPIGVENRTTSSGTIKGAIDDPSTAETYAKTIIEAAIDAGAYVIVDWHAHAEQTSAATAFFGKLAKEYGDTPNILWEIFNEPKDGPPSENYINSVVGAIRTYSKNVVLIGSKDYSKYPEDTYGQVDSKFSNLAYTLHFYSDQSHYDQLNGKISAAETKGHAVFVSEWGMSSYSGDGGFVAATSAPISSWLSLLNSSKISHCNWSLGNPRANSGAGSTPETSAALGLDASTIPYTTEGGWPDASLTASGKSIKAYLVANNPAWTLSDTTTRVLSPLAITSGKTTGLVLGADSVTFGATFSKSAAWTLNLTAPSGAKKSYNGTGINLVVKHPVSSVNIPATVRWAGGETVTATLSPGGSKVTYTLGLTSVGPRWIQVHETRLSWENSRIFLPDGLISAAAPVRVMIRNAQGQVIWQKSATMGAYRTIEMGESMPRLAGVNFLEVHSSEAVLRSSMAPTF